MDTRQLTKLGLTDAESQIYTSVLKLGTCTVRHIARECGFHRTNIYDILEQLKEKGLISFFKEGKTTKFSATSPNNFYELLREQKEVLDSIFPELEKAHAQTTDSVQVQVYKGEEGMKASFREIVREAKPLYMFGLRGQLRQTLPVFAVQWLRDLKNKKIPLYGIYTVRGNPPPYYTAVKYVSKQLDSPVATFIYGDSININIWEPTLVAIVIKSKFVAHTYKKHFDLLWKVAKK